MDLETAVSLAVTWVLLAAIAVFAILATSKGLTGGEELVALLALVATIGLFLVHIGLL